MDLNGRQSVLRRVHEEDTQDFDDCALNLEIGAPRRQCVGTHLPCDFRNFRRGDATRWVRAALIGKSLTAQRSKHLA